MVDWKRKLDDFLQLNELEILQGKGNVSHNEMEEVVKEELKKYHQKKQLQQDSTKILKAK